MSLEHKTSHAIEGILKLIPEYWGKPRIAAVLQAALNEVQALEDAAWSVLDQLDVDTCERFMLQRFAKIVGEPTEPDALEAFRSRVKCRVAINRSRATMQDLYDVVSLLTTPGSATETTDAVNILTAAYPEDGAYVINEAAEAGVRVVWIVPGTFSYPDIDNMAAATPQQAVDVGTFGEIHV
jgi:hypothetical protein